MGDRNWRMDLCRTSPSGCEATMGFEKALLVLDNSCPCSVGSDPHCPIDSLGGPESDRDQSPSRWGSRLRTHVRIYQTHRETVRGKRRNKRRELKRFAAILGG